jgi:MFS family permease
MRAPIFAHAALRPEISRGYVRAVAGHPYRAVVGLSLLSSLALSLRVDFLAVWGSERAQLGDSQLGAAYVAAAAVEVAAGLLAGRACDGFGCRRVAVVAATANAAVLIGFAACSRSPAAAMVLIPLSTAGDAVLWVALAVTIARLAPDALERLYARQRTANAIGLGLGPLLGAVLLTLGWSALWLACAAVLAAVAGLALAGIPSDAEREPAGATGLGRFLRAPGFLLLWGGSALSYVVLFVYEIVVPVAAVRDGVLGLGAVGLLLAINPVLTIVLQVPLTSASRRASRRVVLVAGTATGGLAACALIWRDTVLVLVAVLVVYTVCEILASPAQSAAVAAAAPPGSSGAWIAAVGTSYSVAYAVAPAGGFALHGAAGDALWLVVAGAGLASAALFGACLARRPFAGVSTQPDGGVRGLDGSGDDRSQLLAERVEVDLLAQPLAEPVDRRLRVVARPVEPAVHGALDHPAQRLERGGDRQRRHGDGQRAR